MKPLPLISVPVLPEVPHSSHLEFCTFVCRGSTGLEMEKKSQWRDGGWRVWFWSPMGRGTPHWSGRIVCPCGLHTGALLSPQRAAALPLWKTRFLAPGTVGTCGA